MRRRYRFDRKTGKMVEIPSCQAKGPAKGPFLWSDITGYRSPVTGAWVEGRAARKDDLRRHGCVDAREFSWGRRDGS